MKCFLCNGNMTDSFTTDVTDTNSSIIIVRNVPCHKCVQCGEVSFSITVAERLEQLLNTLRTSVTEITVIQYSTAAA